MATKPRLAIIGGGASGAILLLRLHRLFGDQLQIKIIEPDESLGLGLAYSTREEAHLLNVPAENMSVFDEHPLEFVDWLITQGHEPQHIATWPYVPRSWFGSYISQKIAEIPKTQYQHIGARAVSLKRTHGLWFIKTDIDHVVEADAVVIATGFEKNRKLRPLKIVSPAAQARVVQPYNDPRLSSIRPTESVTIIGSGLTAIDVYRQLRRLSKAKVHFLSRHGLFPIAHQEPSQATKVKMPTLAGLSPFQIFQILRTLRMTEAISWIEIVNQVREQTSGIWRAWSPKERRQFFRHLKVYWEISRHRMPNNVAAELNQDVAIGKIQVHAGRIISTEAMGDELTLRYQPRGTKSVAELKSNWVVLATDAGIEHSLSVMGYSAGFKKSNYGLGYVNFGATNLWTLGPSAKASQWESTAVPEIVKHAFALAQEIKVALQLKHTNPFTVHPRSANETYWQHFAVAMGYAFVIARIALFLALHAIFPFIYSDYASNHLRELSRFFTKRRIGYNQIVRRK